MEFKGLLEQWSEDDYARLHPTGTLPFGGLFQTINYSRQVGESKQLELIGMTAVAEIDATSLASRNIDSTKDEDIAA